MKLPVRFYTVFAKAERADSLLKAGAKKLAERTSGILEGGTIRWVCMSPSDAMMVAKDLTKRGLTPPTADSSGDFAIWDMHRGVLTVCDWLEPLQGERGALFVQPVDQAE